MIESENELKPEFLGIHAMSSTAPTNSASRGVMFGSHYTQHLVINGLEEKILYAGPEQEFAKYTLGIKMPENGRVLRVIPKYPQSVGQNSIRMNPELLVIYEREDTKEIDCFTIPYHRSFHQYFGWKCQMTEACERLTQPNAYFAKDTVFADTPGVIDGNSYAYGRNINAAYMSVPGVAEDGVVVSKQLLEKLKFKVYDERIVEFGSTHYPINIYGVGKQFPDIGDIVKTDGLLMTLREHDPDAYAVTLGTRDMQNPDHIFDKSIYARSGMGRVVDIEVIRNNNPNKKTPTGLTTQADRYADALVKYYQNILEAERQIRLERKAKYGVSEFNHTPRFHNLLVYALGMTNHNGRQQRQVLHLMNRRTPIDEYYIKFTIESELTPSIGDKISNSSGNKGVICKIMDESEMPTRPDGVRADIIIDPGPPFNRMNFGQLYELNFTNAARDVTIRTAVGLGLCASTHIDDFNKRRPCSIEWLQCQPIEKVEKALNYLYLFYRQFNDTMPNYFGGLSWEDQLEHLSDVMTEGICRIFMPVDNPKLPIDIAADIDRIFEPTYTPVRYRAPSGNWVTTKKKIRIGMVYMFLLDKLADEWSATSTARLQHFGILSSVMKGDKFNYPFRNSPTRLSGETESRIFAGYSGVESIAELFDRSSNPTTRRNIYWNLLTKENPSDIEEIVDRNQVPLGGGRPIQLVGHVSMCAGFKTVYIPENLY